MPSGSHFGGGGGGSHFGGGFSGGGGSHFGGSSRGGGFFHRGPRIFMFFGHPCHFTSTLSVLFSVITFFAFIAVFLLVISVLCITSSNRALGIMERDYAYYQQMIKNAENNPELQKDAIIKGQFCKDGYGKWYLTYEIEKSDGGVLKGYTYSIYTLEDLNNYPINKVVKAAVDSNPVTDETDSITMDYKDTKLSDDWEYVSNQGAKKTWTIVAIVDGIVLGGLVIGFILILVKSWKKQEAKAEQEQKQNQPRVCPYCGRKTDKSKDKCPNCGANLNY